MSNRIKILYKFIVGSTAFFNTFDDFISKDSDEIWIIEKSKMFEKNKLKSFFIRSSKRDVILYKDLSKDEFIKCDLNYNDSIKLGKYLTKSFINHIGLTIEDLKSLKPLYDKIDEKHEYQKIIYDSYLENNDFILTNEQLENAYEVYKNARNKE